MNTGQTMANGLDPLTIGQANIHNPSTEYIDTNNYE